MLPFSVNPDGSFLMECLWLSSPHLGLRRRSSALGRAQHIPAPELRAVVQIRKQTVRVGLTFGAAGTAGGRTQEKERLIGKVLSSDLQRENLGHD